MCLLCAVYLSALLSLCLALLLLLFVVHCLPLRLTFLTLLPHYDSSALGVLTLRV